MFGDELIQLHTMLANLECWSGDEFTGNTREERRYNFWHDMKSALEDCNNSLTALVASVNFS